MKKTGLFILSFLVLLSINSCSDSEDVHQSDTKIQQTEKKQRILEKFKELGLDPSNVTFSDTIDKSNHVRVESIDDLENPLKIINQIELKGKVIQIEENPLLNYNKTAKSSSTNDLGDWTSFSKTVPISGSLMDFYFYFSYNREMLLNREEAGITGLSSDIIGLTLGFSYEQSYYTLNIRNFGQVQVHMYGILHYNLFVEGVGTVYSRRIVCAGEFTAQKYNNGIGNFLVKMQ
jgi:hypothetical protein